METTITATLTLPIRIETSFVDEIEYRIMGGQTYIELTLPRQTIEVPVDVKKCADAPVAFYRMMTESAATELMHVIRTTVADQIKAHIQSRGVEQGVKND